MPDDAIARSRQIIADHCFGPHDTKAAYERALEIAAACTDDMFDEGLLAAGHASPAAPADDEAAMEKAIYAGWHEFRYPRTAEDEPGDAFKRGVRAALAALGEGEQK